MVKRVRLDESVWRTQKNAGPRRWPGGRILAAQIELLGDALIARPVGIVQVVQQPAALTNHLEKTTAGAVVFFVILEMLGELGDSLGQHGDLHIRRPGVPLVNAKLFDQLRFLDCFHLF